MSGAHVAEHQGVVECHRFTDHVAAHDVGRVNEAADGGVRQRSWVVGASDVSSRVQAGQQSLRQGAIVVEAHVPAPQERTAQCAGTTQAHVAPVDRTVDFKGALATVRLEARQDLGLRARKVAAAAVACHGDAVAVQSFAHASAPSVLRGSARRGLASLLGAKSRGTSSSPSSSRSS